MRPVLALCVCVSAGHRVHGISGPVPLRPGQFPEPARTAAAPAGRGRTPAHRRGALPRQRRQAVPVQLHVRRDGREGSGEPHTSPRTSSTRSRRRRAARLHPPGLGRRHRLHHAPRQPQQPDLPHRLGHLADGPRNRRADDAQAAPRAAGARRELRGRRRRGRQHLRRAQGQRPGGLPPRHETNILVARRTVSGLGSTWGVRVRGNTVFVTALDGNAGRRSTSRDPDSTQAARQGRDRRRGARAGGRRRHRLRRRRLGGPGGGRRHGSREAQGCRQGRDAGHGDPRRLLGWPRLRRRVERRARLRRLATGRAALHRRRASDHRRRLPGRRPPGR